MKTISVQNYGISVEEEGEDSTSKEPGLWQARLCLLKGHQLHKSWNVNKAASKVYTIYYTHQFLFMENLEKYTLVCIAMFKVVHSIACR